MWPGTGVCQNDYNKSLLHKKINDEKDLSYFRRESPAYKTLLYYVEILDKLIEGTGEKVLNRKYKLQNETFQKCSDFIETLEKCCDETDLQLNRTAGTLRFGHVAYRDWFDKMKTLTREFISEIAKDKDEQLREELVTYLSESFGNRMRIDYGTGHELNFIIFTMGLSFLVEPSCANIENSELIRAKIRRGWSFNDNHSGLTKEQLEDYVIAYGWDVHSLFAHEYLKLCRQVQTKFRLEPAGSKGAYNLDDFQLLPFLFGASQLHNLDSLNPKEFYIPMFIDLCKDDFIFHQAVDFILKNKRGPFNEHSYALWELSRNNSWSYISSRCRARFTRDLMDSFPVAQHFLFGDYIMKWN